MSGAVEQQWAQEVSVALSLPRGGVQAVLRLAQEGATVPFLARYRKEATGGFDETQIRAVIAEHERLQVLEKRRGAILASLQQGGHLTETLARQVRGAETLSELEDLYAPFKPKRQTRADKARERGLLPLGEAMWQQGPSGAESLARAYVDSKRDVPDVAAALAGARDICAERLANDAELRKRTREMYWRHCRIAVSKTPKHRAAVTKYDSQVGVVPRLADAPSHRWLACRRGEAEGVLKLSFEFESDSLEQAAQRTLPRPAHPSWREQNALWLADAFQRLLVPAAKSAARQLLDENAEVKAAEVFATNLRDLLLAAPLGARPVLGIDPGQRTGCKCTLVDGAGKLIAKDTLFLVQGDAQQDKARTTLTQLLRQLPPAAVAVGNGTHGRETERFVKETLRALPGTPPICVSVNEAGASIYSASDTARREFPDLDVSYRGAVSIARRLQDPLAELVKLDPKSIGVGQYQHDIDEKLLSERLDAVVESCVNAVGVDLNTASPELLSRVSGLGPKLAERIVQHRHSEGPFAERRALLAVKGLGAKAFEQAAGFLRVRESKNPLDDTGVHPEKYDAVAAMARSVKKTVAELLGDAAALSRLKQDATLSETVGSFTLQDILAELAAPGRDPRADFEAPAFADGVTTLEDVKVGMRLSGVVTNVAAFGAFVDIGVHQDGLVHVSKLANHFVKDPSEIVHVGQQLTVEVLEVDTARKRISLSNVG